jgi:pimeloyl-ACP methyl ester carboxylesterase
MMGARADWPLLVAPLESCMHTITTLGSRFLLTLVAALATAGPAHADGSVGTTFPPNFPVIVDASLGKALIGFGASGPITRTPVIFVHGNNDTPFATACNPYGRMRALAQHLADNGYALSELWGLGYQGDQCDLQADQTIRSSTAHTAAANVPDLRRFVRAVLRYTGARRVDIVGHSLGVVVAREWLRQDEDAGDKLRRLVAIDGPNQGIINCSPSPLNYWQAPSLGGFKPSSALCVELGSPNTPFLKRLNRHRGDWREEGRDQGSDGDNILVIRNADTSFVYFPKQDGVLAAVPAEDSFGQPNDFSGSARLRGARELNLTGQGIYDPILATTHLGILNSPDTWKATLAFLKARRGEHERP